MTVKKEELIVRTILTSGKRRVDVEPIIKAFLESLEYYLTHGERIHIEKFGDFHIRTVKSRYVNHPKTQERMLIPPVTSVAFKMSYRLKKLIRGWAKIHKATPIK